MTFGQGPASDVIVSRVARFDPPLEHPPAELLRSEAGLAIELEDGRRVRLDPGDTRSIAYAQILESLRTQRRPVYLELDPATAAIRRMLIPHVTRVLAINPIDSGVFGVEIERSHARHVLRGSQPNFGQLERQLRDALGRLDPVVLTEDDAHNILDVRAFVPGPDDRPLPPFPPFPSEPRPRLPWPLDRIL
jgi:hypothetical protein